MADLSYRIEGLSCRDCAQRVRSAVARLDGVREVTVDHASGLMLLTPVQTSPAEDVVAEAVRSAGYRLITSDSSADQRDRR